MTTNTHSIPSTKIRIALPADPGGSMQGETLWAAELPHRPGRYRLRNNSFMTALRLHDVVRTELDGCGIPQVVGIDQLHPGPTSAIRYPELVDEQEVQRVADSWRAIGAEYSEGMAGLLFTAWASGATRTSVRDVVAATAPGWTLLRVLNRRQRALILPGEIDVTLDLRTPEDIEREHRELCDCCGDDDAGWQFDDD